MRTRLLPLTLLLITVGLSRNIHAQTSTPQKPNAPTPADFAKLTRILPGWAALYLHRTSGPRSVGLDAGKRTHGLADFRAGHAQL
jgi:hypothetical protein